MRSKKREKPIKLAQQKSTVTLFTVLSFADLVGGYLLLPVSIRVGKVCANILRNLPIFASFFFFFLFFFFFRGVGSKSNICNNKSTAATHVGFGTAWSEGLLIMSVHVSGEKI